MHNSNKCLNERLNDKKKKTFSQHKPYTRQFFLLFYLFVKETCLTSSLYLYFVLSYTIYFYLFDLSSLRKTFSHIIITTTETQQWFIYLCISLRSLCIIWVNIYCALSVLLFLFYKWLQFSWFVQYFSTLNVFSCHIVAWKTVWFWWMCCTFSSNQFIGWMSLFSVLSRAEYVKNLENCLVFC